MTLRNVSEVVAKPVSAVVELLEAVLAEARAGKVQSVALAYATEKDRTTSHSFAWREGSSLLLLLGEAERMKYALIKRSIEGDT